MKATSLRRSKRSYHPPTQYLQSHSAPPSHPFSGLKFLYHSYIELDFQVTDILCTSCLAYNIPKTNSDLYTWCRHQLIVTAAFNYILMSSSCHMLKAIYRLEKRHLDNLEMAYRMTCKKKLSKYFLNTRRYTVASGGRGERRNVPLPETGKVVVEIWYYLSEVYNFGAESEIQEILSKKL